MIVYVDSSVLVSAYLSDEPLHAEARLLLETSVDPLVTAEITLVELVAAMMAASRAGRIDDPIRMLEKADVEIFEQGLVSVAEVFDEAMIGRARDVAVAVPVHASDAIHIASAMAIADSADAELVFRTEDRQQARAAEAVGLRVA